MATILVIDDSDAQRDLIRAAVEESGIFERILEAADGFAGLRLLLAESVDVVLCDLTMPGIDGDKLLRMKTSSPGGENIPFLFLTASTNADRKARLLMDGACDAIDKPFHPADLVARLQLHLKVKRLQDELMVKNATLARLSTVDSLTGLRSRRFLDETLSIEFLRARRYGTSLSVAMIDLDEFKEINDLYGHPAGDAVLREVAEIVLGSMRATDIAGRYGGDELMLVMPQNHLDGVIVLAERLRAAVEAAKFVPPGSDDSIRTSLSVGIAEYVKTLESPDELVAQADRALYKAKQKGRNRVEVYRGE